MATGARSRLEYIDGMRALAAIWVALHHVFETSQPIMALNMPMLGPLIASLSFGQFPVMIFLMLSGFCLYYPYVRKNPEGPSFNTGFGQFLIRRWMRIAPPYFAAAAFCLVLQAFPQVQVGRWKETGPIDFGTLVSHVLFLHNLSPRYSVKIDYPMWSIGLEWQLYLLFPILVWAFRRRGVLVSLAVSCAIVVVARMTYRMLPEVWGSALREGPFAYLEIFSAGMLAASLTVRHVRLAPRWVLACVAIAGAIGIRLGTGNGLAHDLSASAAAFCVLLLAARPDSLVSRVLSTPSLVRIGFYSYSIYLMHAPFLHLVWLPLRTLGLSPDGLFWVLLLLAMPIIFTLCYVFHLLAERPFMRTKAAAKKDLVTAAETGAA